MSKITPHLWFDSEAVEAAELYASTFPSSRVTDVSTLRDTPSGDCDAFSFELCGQPFMAISAGPLFAFTPAVSFLVRCSKDFPLEGVEIPAEDEDKLMHVALPIGEDDLLMASDALESLGQRVVHGNSVYVSVHPESREEADRIFAALSEEGEVEMPIADQAWGDYYGEMPFPDTERERLTRVGPRGLGVALGLGVDDLDAALADCRQAGCTITSEPMDEAWGERVFECVDPFGYQWELSQPIAGAPVADPFGAVAASWFGREPS